MGVFLKATKTNVRPTLLFSIKKIQLNHYNFGTVLYNFGGFFVYIMGDLGLEWGTLHTVCFTHSGKIH